MNVLKNEYEMKSILQIIEWFKVYATRWKCCITYTHKDSASNFF